MTILEIVAAGYPGGGTNHVLQILRGLRNRCSFTVVTQSDSYLLREASALEIPCVGINFFSSRLDLRVSTKLRRIIAKVRPDLVHVHGGRAAFFLALSGTSVPTVYTVHGFHFLHKPMLARWFAVMAERVAMRHADYGVFVCQYDRDIAAAYRLLSQGQPSCVIPNGIPAPCVTKCGADEERLIGFVGRLEYQKDPLLFLDSLQQLPEYRAVMIGTGSLENCLRKEIESRGLADRITMRGPLSHPDTLEAMCRFETLVMTSRWEGLPLLPLEALWMGVPVVATDVGGMGEIIEDGKSGMLVKGRSSAQIARAVKMLSEDAELRARVVKEGQERVQRLFSEERMLSSLQALYDRVGRTTRETTRRDPA